MKRMIKASEETSQVTYYDKEMWYNFCKNYLPDRIELEEGIYLKRWVPNSENILYHVKFESDSEPQDFAEFMYTNDRHGTLSIHPRDTDLLMDFHKGNRRSRVKSYKNERFTWEGIAKDPEVAAHTIVSYVELYVSPELLSSMGVYRQ